MALVTHGHVPMVTMAVLHTEEKRRLSATRLDLVIQEQVAVRRCCQRGLLLEKR